MKRLTVSDAVKHKLHHKHRVSLAEVEQCFLSRQGRLLLDERAQTKTEPPTLWFLAFTDQQRLLKIVYIQNGSRVILKTAYEPNEVEQALYARWGHGV
jgi:uncharacterized DUF497 family protein